MIDLTENLAGASIASWLWLAITVGAQARMLQLALSTRPLEKRLSGMRRVRDVHVASFVLVLIPIIVWRHRADVLILFLGTAVFVVSIVLVAAVGVWRTRRSTERFDDGESSGGTRA